MPVKKNEMPKEVQDAIETIANYIAIESESEYKHECNTSDCCSNTTYSGCNESCDSECGEECCNCDCSIAINIGELHIHL